MTRTIADALKDVKDYGQERLDAANERRAFATGLIAGICARHGVSVQAVVGKHPARLKHHVARARAHCAATLRAEGFGWKPIGRYLGIGHPAAIRAVQIWNERDGRAAIARATGEAA
jgi:hypothetical protein